MCLALGKRDEGSELHCVDFKWSGLCGTSICVIYRDGSFTSTVSQIMTLVYATIGPVADYGTFGRWLLLIFTAICWAAQFASMSLTCKSHSLKTYYEVCSNGMSISPKSLGYCDGIVYHQLHFTGSHPIILLGTFPSPGSQYTPLTRSHEAA